jgi:aubergine-like protein
MDLKSSNKFYSSIALHNNGEECASNIRTHIQKAIYSYKEEHGALPARIIFYRDGVGDGQINMVMEYEVNSIKGMLEGMYPKDELKFAFVIVNKRINTRFFEEKRDQYDNPVPGTVVDTVVTLPER